MRFTRYLLNYTMVINRFVTDTKTNFLALFAIKASDSEDHEKNETAILIPKDRNQAPTPPQISWKSP